MSDFLYSIKFNGREFASDMDAKVIKSIEVVDGSDSEIDIANVVMADIDGMIAMPAERAKAEISIGAFGDGQGLVFDGFVDELRSVCSSQDTGRELHVHCKSADLQGRSRKSARIIGTTRTSKRSLKALSTAQASKCMSRRSSPRSCGTSKLWMAAIR